jgi:hypothetical protein
MTFHFMVFTKHMIYLLFGNEQCQEYPDSKNGSLFLPNMPKKYISCADLQNSVPTGTDGGERAAAYRTYRR